MDCEAHRVDELARLQQRARRSRPPRDEVADAFVHVEEERASGYSMTSAVMHSPFDCARSTGNAAHRTIPATVNPPFLTVPIDSW
jgi:hypothetical protein